MAGKKATKGGKKGRKIGRNKKWCEKYRNEGTELRNKIRRLRRHVNKFPEDQRARSALTKLS